MDQEATEPNRRRVKSEVGSMVVETGVIVAHAQVKQDGRRHRAIVVQPCGVSGNEGASVRADRGWQTIRAAQRSGDLALGIDPVSYTHLTLPTIYSV